MAHQVYTLPYHILNMLGASSGFKARAKSVAIDRPQDRVSYVTSK